MSELAPIIPPTTGASTATVDVRKKRALLTCDDLGSETITIQVQAGSYVDLFSEGEQQVLSATSNAVYLPAPGNYQISKPSTAGEVGVYTMQD